ncbi:hypothetical protein niasHS_015336 [Heterodera schachtii]|uniref:Uncharacterized protein n=2 Tax=Heterodera TaxID=34509 RepID=A0ABD2I5R8_HETSC
MKPAIIAALLIAFILHQISAVIENECGQCKHCLDKNNCLLNMITAWAQNGEIDWPRVLGENPNLWGKEQKVLADAKATEDKQFQDPKFEQNFKAMNAIGMTHRGAYHYFRGEPGSAGALEQVQHFLNTSIRAGFNVHKDFAVVNVEIYKNEGADKVLFTGKLLNFVKLLKSKVPNLFIHTSADHWSALVNNDHDEFFAQFPLSVIDYDNQQSPALPRPWKVWQRWLHTVTVPVNGISGNVWLSRVNCSVKMMPNIF